MAPSGELRGNSSCPGANGRERLQRPRMDGCAEPSRPEPARETPQGSAPSPPDSPGRDSLIDKSARELLADENGRFLQANERLHGMQKDAAKRREQARVAGVARPDSPSSPAQIRIPTNPETAPPPEHTGHARESHGTRKGYTLVTKGERSGLSSCDEPSSDNATKWYLNFAGTQRDLDRTLETYTIPGGSVASLLKEAIKINSRPQDHPPDQPSGVWRFTSRLKSYPMFSTWTAAQMVRWLDEHLPSVGGWRSLPRHNFYGDDEDPRDAVIRAWPRIGKSFRWLPAPRVAFPLSKRYPLSSPTWTSRRDAKFRRLVSLCFWYATIMDACEYPKFFLSCRDAGRLIGSSHVIAWGLLSRAKDDGILVETRKGQRGAYGNATEFRVNFERIDVEFASPEAAS
jgi:hypothetical protein